MFKKSVTWYLICAMFLLAIVPRAEAGFIPSAALNITESQREADIDKIRTFLETKVVTQRLQDLGYSAQEVQERLSILSDRQIHEYAQQLDDMKVGGDGLGAVVAVLVIIILILVILHLTGHKVIVS